MSTPSQVTLTNLGGAGKPKKGRTGKMLESQNLGIQAWVGETNAQAAGTKGDQQ